MSGSGKDRGNLDAILATAEHRRRLDSQALGVFSLTLLGVTRHSSARMQEVQLSLSRRG